MPSSSCVHHESWFLVIDKEEGDDWPDLPPYAGASYEIRPDRISARITRGIPEPHVTLSGLRVRKDGTAGSLRTSHTVWANDDLSWVAEVIQAARSRHNVTEEALSR